MHHDILFQVFLFTVYYCIGHWLFFSDASKPKATTSTTTEAADPKAVAATATPAATTPNTTTKVVTIVTTPATTASTVPQATPCGYLTEIALVKVKATVPAATATPTVNPKSATETQSPLQSDDKPPSTLDVVPDPILTPEGDGSGGFGQKVTKGKPKSTTGRTRSRKTIAALSA